LIYYWLLRFLPARLAGLLTVIWFVVLLAAIIYFGMTVPEAEFRYREI